MIFHCADEQATEKIAADMAAGSGRGDIFCLSGDLGSGKSVFARAFIRALAGQPDLEVPSPTYTLVQVYESPKGPVWHFDLYRIKDAEEIFELGWEDALSGEGIALIEWPERLGQVYYPERCKRLAFEADPQSPSARIITTKQEK